jgi:hypothetical protein
MGPAIHSAAHHITVTKATTILARVTEINSGTVTRDLRDALLARTNANAPFSRASNAMLANDLAIPLLIVTCWLWHCSLNDILRKTCQTLTAIPLKQSGSDGGGKAWASRAYPLTGYASLL